MTFSKKQREKIYCKCNNRCAYCGNPIYIKDMQIDHIIPQKNYLMHVKNKYKVPEFLKHLTENDLNHYDNLLPTCRICNKWKDTFHLELFRTEIEAQIKRLNERSSNYRIAKKYGLIEEIKKPVVFHFERLLNVL